MNEQGLATAHTDVRHRLGRGDRTHLDARGDPRTARWLGVHDPEPVRDHGRTLSAPGEADELPLGERAERSGAAGTHLDATTGSGLGVDGAARLGQGGNALDPARAAEGDPVTGVTLESPAFVVTALRYGAGTTDVRQRRWTHRVWRVTGRRRSGGIRGGGAPGLVGPAAEGEEAAERAATEAAHCARPGPSSAVTSVPRRDPPPSPVQPRRRPSSARCRARRPTSTRCRGARPPPALRRRRTRPPTAPRRRGS